MPASTPAAFYSSSHHFPADSARAWPFYRRRASTSPIAMISAADLGFDDLEASPFWRLDPPTSPTIDIHLAAHGIAYDDLVRFITKNRYDEIADYDVFYEFQTLETRGTVSDIFIATMHADKDDIGGWAAVKRLVEPTQETFRRYTVQLSNIFVIPEFRGFGLGRALVHTALRPVKSDLMIIAAGAEPFAVRFHAECVSEGGKSLGQLFSTQMRDFVAEMPSGNFQAFESWIE